MKCLKLTILLLFSYALLASHQLSDNSEKLWRQGKAAASNGNIEEALHIWETARKTNNATDFTDPRIGIDYIELATSHKKLSFYKEASAMFMWGISGKCSESYREELILELERIMPILKPEDYRRLRKNSKKDLSALCSGMAKIWKQLDPTISTEYNERLIEHWERIAYAKKHFTRNSSTVYDSDDRALIYVKLGEPDMKRSGNLHFSQPLVRSWVNDVIDRQFRGAGTSNFSGGDSSGSAADEVGANSEAGLSQRSMSQLWARIDMADRITKEAELLHRYQRYEIWLYDQDLLHTDEDLVYIFGQDGGTGSFGLRKSLDEMIPGKAFRNRSTRGSILRPGLLLQLMYYQQFTHLDNYFADAFSNIESRLLVTNGLHRTTSMAIKDQNEHKLSFIQVRAPDQTSTYIEKMSNIALKVVQYRFLDNNNIPYLATYIEGKPHKALLFDQLKNEKYNSNVYQLLFNARISNKNHEILSEQFRESDINIKSRGLADEMEVSKAYFEIPHHYSNFKQTFVAELIDSSKNKSLIGRYAFPENIRAIGFAEPEQPKMLDTDKSNLEMSDILFGIEDEDVGNNDNRLFRVVHDRIIPTGKNIQLYFEIYHLKVNSSKTNKFQVKYRVHSTDRNILQRIFGGGVNVSLTLNYETLGNNYKSDLEIVTSSFNPGNYQLSLKVIEPSSGREIERVVEFFIEKREN